MNTEEKRASIRGATGELLELIVVERSLIPGYSEGDLKLAVRLEALGFTGRCQAWVMESDWNAFVSAMVVLERERRGKATLSSVDPRELSLSIHGLDRAGHLGFECSIGKRGLCDVQLGVSTIEFDSGSLPDLVRELQALGRAN